MGEQCPPDVGTRRAMFNSARSASLLHCKTSNESRNVAGPNGRRPLNYAAIRNDTAMITALLNEGANINLANRSGFTPLHHAGEAGSAEAATLLIAKGANLTARNARQQTAEQIATVTHHADILKILHQAVAPAQ